MTRPYRSSLREEQSVHTREKLIQAGIDIVADAGDGELTVRSVAARAGISVPTAYRHFPDRETLLDEMAAWIGARVAGTSVPTTADGIPLWARTIYAAFERHDRFMRAQLNTPAGRLVRARHQKGRNPKLLEMTRKAFPSATPATQRRLTGLIQILVTVPTWVSLHDNWMMTGAEAGEAAAWAIETLLAELRRHPAALDFELPAVPPGPETPNAPPPRAGGKIRRSPGKARS